MCGRYAASRDTSDLVGDFEVEIDEVGDLPPEESVDPSWNIAPTDTAAVVLRRHRRGDSGGEVVRQLRPLRWGLVPSWSRDTSRAARMINARVETVLESSAFRRAALARRCLVPADGWYEWQASPVAQDAKGRPRKQPFFVRLHSGDPMAFAGLYEIWREPSRDADDPFAWLTTFTVVTAPAEQGLDRLHDRMPVVVPPDRWDRWLNPGVREEDDVRSLLTPVEPGRFVAYPVSTAVGSVRNNGPHLVDPAPPDQLEGVVDPATGEILGGQREALF